MLLFLIILYRVRNDNIFTEFLLDIYSVFNKKIFISYFSHQKAVVSSLYYDNVEEYTDLHNQD